MLAPWILLLCATPATLAAPIQSAWGPAPIERVATLVGTVIAPDGSPIAAADVQIRGSRGGRSSTLSRAVSDGSGRFVLPYSPTEEVVIEWDWHLEAHAPGFASSEIHHFPFGSDDFDIGPLVLHRPVTVRGRVTNEAGEPIRGAEIRAALGMPIGLGQDDVERKPIAVTDADGRFTSISLPPGLVTLGAAAVGFADRVLEPRKLVADGDNLFDFTLETERAFRLHVESASGTTLAGAYAEPLPAREDRAPWTQPKVHMAFWRGRALADVNGIIVLRGLPKAHAGKVRVGAPGHRAELDYAFGAERRVVLQPVIPIEFRAERARGAPPPVIAAINVQEGPYEPDQFCGTGEEWRWARLSPDSPAVEVLAPDHWRIAWNSDDCYIDGGEPGAYDLILADGTRIGGPIHARTLAGGGPQAIHCPAPVRIRGRVQDKHGKALRLKLGFGLPMMPETLYVFGASDDEGRFQFDAVRAGEPWIESLDPGWAIDSLGEGIEVQPGESLDDLVLVARPIERDPPLPGILRVDGKPPGRRVMLALAVPAERPQDQFFPLQVAWTDEAGRFELQSTRPGKYDIVPKHGPDPSDGGWREFHREFARRGEHWKWTVEILRSGTSEFVVELPSEDKWDQPRRTQFGHR